MTTSARRLSRLDAHLGYWLRFVSNHVSHAFSRKVEARGVTVAEWVVLRALCDAAGLQPTELADRLGLSRGAVSKLVERLCRKNLVIRTTSPADRRRQTLELTAAGRRLVPELARLADENDREHFGHLDAAARAQLAATLQDLVRRHGWKDVPLA